MALSYFNSDTLIADVKRRALIPTNQNTFQSDDFLAFANEEMAIGLIPSILQFHEEYFVTTINVPLVANQNNYPLPERAIGNRLRDLFYRDTQGNLREMSRIPEEDIAFYQTVTLENRFVYFFVQGNDVVLLPKVGANPTGSLVMVYYIRPNQLVTSDRISTIQSVSIDSISGTTTFTVDQIPSGFSTSVTMDLLQAKSGHRTVAIDITPTSISTTNKTITFTTSDIMIGYESDVAQGYTLKSGDFICFSNECYVPQIPDELHSVLSQRVAIRCMEALGDAQGLQMANSKLQDMEVKTGNLIDNRVEGAPRKVNNIRGLLRMSKVRRKGWV